MKKRILSLLLAFLMLVGMFPAQAFATDSSDASIIQSDGMTEPPADVPAETPCPTCGQYACSSEHLNWCAECWMDDCGVDHVAVLDVQPCDTCGSADCDGVHENWCDICQQNDCGHFHCDVCGTIDCPVEHGFCAKCGEMDCTADHSNWCDICERDNCGVDHKAAKNSSDSVYMANVGRKATFNPIYMQSFYICADPTLVNGWSSVQPTTDALFTAELLLVIVDVYDKGTELWYKVEAAEGHTLPASLEASPWIFQTDFIFGPESDSLILQEAEEKCPICGESDCSTEHKQCELCGEYDCVKLHFFCEHCQNYTCTQAHFVCPACGEIDCESAHIYCSYCNTYDSCDIDHAAANKPVTSPVLPAEPTLPDGVEIGICDEQGDMLTELILFPNERSSISAWATLENASYQWQIRYDAANDLWTDIQGQTEQGIIISAAMVMAAIENTGSAAIRCEMTSGQQTLISDAVEVVLGEQLMMANFNQEVGAAADNGISPLAEDDENKVNVIVNYLFTDGSIAASPWAATLPKGEAYTTATPITLPIIAGYVASIGESANAANAAMSDGKLTLTFSAADLENDCTINIVYQPAPVKVVVNHHWQNVDDDYYTLHETVIHDSTTETQFVTGTLVTKDKTDKSYEGFYSLLHEEPYAAADGSTVVDVYYDRYYYLMTFELSGGYGMEAVYARYGAPIPEMDEPTRPGYTLSHWTLDGKVADIPDYMPARNTSYVAVWTPGDPVNYTVVYWKENADDTKYSYWTQVTRQERPGTLVSGSDSVASYVSDAKFFTYNDQLTDKNVEVKGDGSTVINVYYNRNYYTIYFKGYGKCALEAHTHGNNCARELICGEGGHTHDASCVRTLVCTKEEHIHDETCLIQCGMTIHTAHTKDCLVCDKLHPEHTDDCYTLVCNHTHTLDCYYTNSNYYTLKPTDEPDEETIHIGDNIYTYTTGNNWYSTTYYYLKLGDNWYCAYYRNTPSNTVQIHHRCTHTHSINDGCYQLICPLPLHAEHTEAEGCYSDEIHTQHTDTCYDHASHSHAETCYIYECGLEPHEHDASCYRDCYKPEHTHNNTCSTNDSKNVIYVITAKYEQNIDNIWPTYDRLKAGDYAYEDASGNVENASGDRFRGWDVDGVDDEAVSKRVTMTKDLCDTSDGEKNAIAQYSARYFYKLYYMFESFDQSSGENGNDRKKYDSTSPNVDAKYYDSSSTFYQELYYSSNTTFGQKEITGMNPVGVQKQEVGGTIYNFLYYTRNRWDLRFHNVSEVVKTQADIMFEQPLTDYKDGSGNLLRDYTPDYPSDSYEPDTMVFEGWYTTPECFPGTEVDFDRLTMPNNDLTLYAHWVPVSRTVSFFLDKGDMEKDIIIPERMAQVYAALHNGAADANSPYIKFNTRNEVPNKSFLSDVGTPGVSEGYNKTNDIEGHPYEGYTFVGWFYMEDGEEKAFDPANMPVTKDLDLYGKWSSNVLCPYEIRFILDANGNGVLDEGETTRVADPVTGSTLAGNSRTFDAKGHTALYADYQTGYYPNVASHTIDFKASDKDGVVYTFLYKPHDPVPYTVEYRDKASGEIIEIDGVPVPNKVVSDNTKAVVTENFKPIAGYMPDAFQKTLVVVPGGENKIVFYYTVDKVHAPYQVNHYVQTLDGNGWTLYRSADFTGDIGKIYSADAIDITGFTYSEDISDELNADDITVAGETVKGTLTDEKGMQLNFYYTRNAYTYKVQYLEFGTNEVLADEVEETVLHGTYVTENAITIRKDMDGDGKFEDFQLYEATDPSQSATITGNGTVFYFYYVRCTAESLSVSKVLTGEGADQNLVFKFTLNSTATDFATHNNGSYAYEIKSGDTVVTSGRKNVADGMISFELKAGQTIIFSDLPTAVYTITEQALPVGYYESSAKNQEVTLTKDAEENITVTNSYDPARLSITKTVDVVEENGNIPEVQYFEFTIKVPDGVTGSYDYSIGTATYSATVSDGSMTINLENGQTAVFHNLPVGNYTVTEADYSAYGYDSNYKVNASADYTEGQIAAIVTERGTTQRAEFLNKFPVGDLSIEKIVGKEFFGTEWKGDTFTFTVERTNAGRPLKEANKYDLYEGVTKAGTAEVKDGKLTVAISFDAEDASEMDEASEQGATVSRKLLIKNLPTGTYSVKENENSVYVQTPDGLQVDNLTIPAESVVASFTNTLKRGNGNLYLEKELVAAENHDPNDLPKGIKFNFTVELLECAPAENKEYTIYYKDEAGNSVEKFTDGTGVPASVVMTDGKITVALEAGMNITVVGLPEGQYRITEETIPYYANAFAHKENGAWIPQSSQTTDDGKMFTEIDVIPGATTEIKCTNTYPVDRAELIIQKLVDKVYDRDVLPDDSFTFTVTLEEDDVSSYAYKIYNADGSLALDGTANVEGGAFSIALKAGQYAVIPDMPVCGYTVSENVDAGDFNASYSVYVYETGETASTTVDTSGVVNASGTGASVSRTFSAGKTDAVVFTNEYKRHLGNLTITKKVNGGNADDVFIFHIKGTDVSNSYIDMDVSIEGSGSITIYDLPLGNYTVTEDTSWSWRYTAAVTSAAVDLSEDPDAEVTFTNTYNKTQWLDYAVTMPNVFGKKENE